MQFCPHTYAEPENSMPASDRQRLYVWVWLPSATRPVPAGVIEQWDTQVVFTYGKSYLANAAAIPIYLPELPLRPGLIRPPRGLQAPGSIRDAAPDSWGQRVILHRLTGYGGLDADTSTLDLLTYLVESGSNRIGGLDFQRSPTDYIPRNEGSSLEELVNAVAWLEEGKPLSEELLQALQGGTSIGGARPKVVTTDESERQWIAKVSTATDTYPVIKAEAAAMDLARRVGLDVPATEFTEVLGRDVLLVGRFDRTNVPGERIMMVSALTILGLDEFLGARYATYPALADEIRKRFKEPAKTLRELFSRIVFNICVGNTDDHARNHSAFWDGTALSLTPAYDLCPQPRAGRKASQSMALDRNGYNLSNLAACVERASYYHLDQKEAREIVELQVDVIQSAWPEVADRARMSSAEREALRASAILNPFALEGLRT